MSSYNVVFTAYNEKKSVALAYFPFMFPFGCFGAHKIYLDSRSLGEWIIYTGLSACGIGVLMLWLIAFNGAFNSTATFFFLCSMFFFGMLAVLLISDAIRIPGIVAQYNQTIAKRTDGRSHGI